MIERMALNAAVDADKLQKLMAMHERMIDRANADAFDAAKMAAQAEIPIIPRDGRIDIKARDRPDGRRTDAQSTPYAKYESLMPIIQPILHRHGLSLTHRTGTSPDGKMIRVTAVLKGHGHTDDSSYFDIEPEGTGSKNSAQARKSAYSYARRITAEAILNIVTRGDDDDGKASGRPRVVGEPITAEQLEDLVQLCAASQISEPSIVEHLNGVRPKGHPAMDRLSELPRSRYEEVKQAIAVRNAAVSRKHKKPEGRS